MSTKITKEFLKVFEPAAREALEALCEQHGLTVAYKGGTFDREGAFATLKFEFTADGAPSKAEKTFDRLGTSYGLPADAVGKTFVFRGTTYRITGLTPRRPKYPVQAVRAIDGRGFKFAAADVIRALGGADAVTGLTIDLKRKFAGLVCALEPEALTCDGECSASEVASRRASIKRQWGALEVQAGRIVTESEASGWWNLGPDTGRPY